MIKKNLFNLFKVFLLVLGFGFVFLTASCDDKPTVPDNNIEQPSDPEEGKGGNEEKPDDGGSTETLKEDEEETVTYDVSKVKMFGSIVTYDGKPHSLSVSKTNLPKGVTVEYTNNDQTEIGVYTVTATLKDPKGNVLKTLTAKLTINKIVRNVSNVKFVDTAKTWSYQSSYELTATNIPEGVYAVYENNTLSDIGTTTATCKLYDSYDNELLGTLSAKLDVKYRVVNDDNFASASYVTDGSSIYSIVLPSDVASTYTDIVYTNNSGTAQGVYYASALVTTTDNDKFEYRAILTIDNPTNTEFNEFVADMLIELVGDDNSSMNIFFEDYEKFGLEHQEAKWYTYHKSEYSDADYEHDMAIINGWVAELAKYPKNTLSYSQQIDYNVLSKNINVYVDSLSHRDWDFVSLTYVDSYGGYAADIPTTFEGYKLRSKQDIEDLISYVDSVYDALLSCVDYVNDRFEAGKGLSAVSLQGMIDYLDGVSGRKVEGEKQPYYLIAILERNIRNTQTTLGLTDAEVTDYITRLDAAFVKFLAGHTELAVKLETECMKNAVSMGSTSYLYNYGEAGKSYYEYKLRNRIGIKMSIDEYIEYLETTMKKYMTLYSAVKETGNSNSIYNGTVPVLREDSTPNEILEYLFEFAKTIVPELEDKPTIDVAYMDETVTAHTSTLAYYMKSPVDGKGKEYIHLNGQALGKDYLDTVSTLAHEGYPGHLYAYVNTKENPNISTLATIMTCTGHGEGWAKYVQGALMDYISLQKNNAAWTAATQKTKYWSLFMYNLYSRLDVGINYQGWTVTEISNFMKSNNLNSDRDLAKDLLESLNEQVATYSAYGYGGSLFYELHEEAKAILGTSYNEVEFNTMLLENGWSALSDLVDHYNEYMTKKCFLIGLTYTPSFKN